MRLSNINRLSQKQRSWPVNAHRGRGWPSDLEVSPGKTRGEKSAAGIGAGFRPSRFPPVISPIWNFYFSETALGKLSC